MLRGIGWGVGRLLFILAAPGARLRCAIWSCAFPRCPLPSAAPGPKPSWCFAKPLSTAAGCGLAAEALVRSRVQLTGALHELEGDTATIVFAPHFYSMDAGGLALPLNTPREFTSIFATNPDPVLDAWFMAGRQRFGKVRMLNRADGVKPIIQCLRKGGLLYLLPDMDYGPSDSVFRALFCRARCGHHPLAVALCPPGQSQGGRPVQPA